MRTEWKGLILFFKMLRGHAAITLKQTAFCTLFYWVNISHFHKSIRRSQGSQHSVFATNGLHWRGVSIPHVKCIWTVSPAVPDRPCSIASPPPVSPEATDGWLTGSTQHRGRWRGRAWSPPSEGTVLPWPFPGNSSEDIKGQVTASFPGLLQMTVGHTFLCDDICHEQMGCPSHT